MSDFNWSAAGENLLNTTLSVWAAREGASIAAGTNNSLAQQQAMTAPEVDTATGYESQPPSNSADMVPWYRRRVVIGLGAVGLGGLVYYLAKGRK